MIYFIQQGDDGPIKIGSTCDNVGHRLSALQIGNPKPLAIRGVMDGDRGNEKELHRRFLDSHIRGEWFTNGKLILDFVKDNTRELCMSDIPDETTKPKMTMYSVRLDDDVIEMLKQKSKQVRVPHNIVVRCLIEDAARGPAVNLVPVPRDTETEQE